MGGQTSTSLPPLVPASGIMEISRFMGPWYVIGVKPTYFEIGAVNAVESYKWNAEKELIDIDFTFNQDKPDGPVKKIPQTGWIHNKETNMEWRISPFWPVRLPYTIIELDPSPGKDPYKYTVIGYPNRAYVWIMAREPKMDEQLYKDILDRLVKNHQYDLTGLVKVLHTTKK